MGLGNWQPAAEFNIYVDPQAAEMVFQSGIPVVMAGLDVTHRAQILPADIERFRQIGNPVSTIVAELLDFFMAYHKDEKWGFDGAPLHDPAPSPGSSSRSSLPLSSAGSAWKRKENIPRG
jgi:pyrimidine-specific ribonucleoside hydrolase